MPGSRGTLHGRRHRGGRPYTRWKKAVRARWGTVCHICEHDDAYDADHLTPLALWPDQPLDPELARPAHGVRGCPICGRKCNQERGTKAVEEVKDMQQYKPPLDW